MLVKGIGRFSVTGWAANLRLIARKKTKNAPYYILNVNWSRLEDPRKNSK